MRYGIASVIIIIIGAYLRLYDLERFLWIDCAIFGNFVRQPDFPIREFIPMFVGRLTQPETLTGLRLPFAICSILTLPAILLVYEDKKKAVYLMAAIALMPLFYYWGSMARPYTYALLFVVLGWRWPIFYIPALLTTPYALAGLNFWKIRERWVYYIILFVVGFLAFEYIFIYASSLPRFTWRYLTNAKRLWPLPVFSILAHLLIYNNARFQRLFKF